MKVTSLGMGTSLGIRTEGWSEVRPDAVFKQDWADRGRVPVSAALFRVGLVLTSRPASFDVAPGFVSGRATPDRDTSLFDLPAAVVERPVALPALWPGRSCLRPYFTTFQEPAPLL